MSNYYEVNAISQSALTNFSYGPQYYKSQLNKDFDEDSEALKIGFAVDTLLYEPDKFNEKFCNIDLMRPSGQLGTFCDILFKADNDSELQRQFPEKSTKEYAYEQVGFKRDSLATVMSKFEKEGIEYYKQLQNCSNKTILTLDQYNTAKSVYLSLLNNNYTRKELVKTDYSSDIEILNQLEIYWKYNTFDCKSKLDSLWINHTKKTIQIKDLKTTGFHVNNFPKSFLKFRYDLQAAFYTEAVKYYIRYIRPELESYTILPFIFIVESTKYIGTPLIYKCTSNDLFCGWYGGKSNDGIYYKGCKQLLEDLAWHIENDVWNYERIIIEQDGIVEIDAFTCKT